MKAKEELDGKQFMDSEVQVSMIEKPSFLDAMRPTTVFIKGHLQSVSDKAFYNAFANFGNIMLCEVC